MGLGRLERQMAFLIEIDKLKTVLRQNDLMDGSRRENDTEHSWHLGMLVIILEEYFPGIDTLKTLKMVLIHDLVELYAGDTFAFDEAGYQDKEARERAAAEKIFGLLPEDQKEDLIGIWLEFERMETPEAVCAAIVDRLHPLLQNSQSGARAWREHSISVEKVQKRNELILTQGPEVLAGYVRRVIEECREKGYLK